MSKYTKTKRERLYPLSEVRAPELYGPIYAPRFKFTCFRCRKRNDQAVAVPAVGWEKDPAVLLFCSFCHNSNTFHIGQKEKAA